MKRILLTGINGQVGWELQRTLQPLGTVIACDRRQLDLAQIDRFRAAVIDLRPHIIVNPAAYTAVDQAESDAAQAQTINAEAVGVLAEVAKTRDALLVHYSTDYVFDGQQATPYRETDPTAPLGIYGRSKLAGEQAIAAVGGRHLIFRTCWVYGARGRNFLRTILRLAGERDALRVVDDQIGAPTWSRMIATATALALARHQDQQGIYHLAAAGETSWHGFASALVEGAVRRRLLAHTLPIHRIASADFPTPARRPVNSRLDGTRLQHDFALSLPHWSDQLALCLDEMQPIDQKP